MTADTVNAIIGGTALGVAVAANVYAAIARREARRAMQLALELQRARTLEKVERVIRRK